MVWWRREERRVRGLKGGWRAHTLWAVCVCAPSDAWRPPCPALPHCCSLLVCSVCPSAFALTHQTLKQRRIQAREVPDSASIEQEGVKNDAVLYMVFKSGACVACSGRGGWGSGLVSREGAGVKMHVDTTIYRKHALANPSFNEPTHTYTPTITRAGDGWEDVDVTGSGELK